ncbi:MAG: Gfo/Idh/MocA family oxidoreductase [Candidatus Magasanikbacteria bacterium]|nr:Gfo/Idh/MocA family oxidoreductase [Candidatus Magasanikbacteria bacterium]
MLRFGLIGFGRFGKHYARLLQTTPGVQLTTVCASTQASFMTPATELAPGIKTTTDAAEIFGDQTLNCVIIATPLATHFDLIMSALKAGKHVLVEKPMVLTVKQAQAVQKVAASQSNIFMVGFQYLYNDYIRYLKSVLDSFGMIQYFRGEHLYCSPIRSDVGCFQDAGVHDLAILEYFFPGQQFSISGSRHSISHSERDDFTSTTLQYQNGLTAALTTSWFWPEKVRKITIVGDKGMAVFDDQLQHDKLSLWKLPYPSTTNSKGNRSQIVQFEKEAKFIKPSINAREPLLNELEHFIHCVHTGAKPITDSTFACRVTEACEKILQK